MDTKLKSDTSDVKTPKHQSLKKKLSKKEVGGLRPLWLYRYRLAKHFAFYAKRVRGLAGGTLSSNELRDVLLLKREVELCDSDEGHMSKRAQREILENINCAIQDWRFSLERHNTQSVRFLTYDVNTGLQIENEEDAP